MHPAAAAAPVKAEQLGCPASHGSRSSSTLRVGSHRAPGRAEGSAPGWHGQHVVSRARHRSTRRSTWKQLPGDKEVRNRTMPTTATVWELSTASPKHREGRRLLGNAAREESREGTPPVTAPGTAAHRCTAASCCAPRGSSNSRDRF